MSTVLPKDQERFRLLVETSCHGIQEMDTQGNIRYANPASAGMLGYSQEQLAGMNVTDLIPEQDRARFRHDLKALVEQQPSPTPYLNVNRTADDRLIEVQVDWNYTRDSEGNLTGFVSIVSDVSSYLRARRLLDGRNRVLEMLAQGMPLNEMLLAIIEYVESIEPGLMASILLLDANGHTLHTAAAPNLPQPYAEASQQIEIGPGVGSCGTAAYTGERVLVADVLDPPYWTALHDLIEPTGLRSCWSEPVLSRAGRVLGTFAIYSHSPREPGPPELELIETAASLAAVVIEHERAEQNIRDAEERSRLLLESSTEGIFGVDPEGRATFFNPAGARQLGYSVEDLVGEHVHPLIRHTREDGTPLPASECAILAAAHRGENRYVSKGVLWRRDGSHFPAEFWATPVVRENNLEGAVVTFHDITARRRAEAEIQHLAFHDSLTGLANRLLFKEALQAALDRMRRNGQGFALHLLDLDYFKDVNDTLGHPVGDQLLREVADRIKEIVRGSDTFARLGGDEFALLQNALDEPGDASALAEKIGAALERPFRVEGNSLSVSCSIGIVMAEDAKVEVDTLIARADVALYKAKEAGRSRYACFKDSMTLQLREDMQLAQQLTRAIAQDELRVLYQPQVDLASGRLIGVEALMRWQHPQLGLLEPRSFLGIAENRGMISTISGWVLDTACRQAARWAAARKQFGRIAVNLCAHQVTEQGFAERVETALANSGASPSHLELEFTETVLMKSDDQVRADIHRLTEQGICFAIDDFGTGFSSLRYLRVFNADKIKIDREFVGDITDDRDAAEIVKATIALGSSLGLITVAEGVESEQQAAFLRKHKCQQAQGSLFGQAMTAGEVERRWLS